MPTKRADIYRRLPLEHPGSRSKISEQAIVRAHDRTLPLKLKMFASANRAQKSIGATDTKEEAHDWENPKVTIWVLRISRCRYRLSELQAAPNTRETRYRYRHNGKRTVGYRYRTVPVSVPVSEPVSVPVPATGSPVTAVSNNGIRYHTVPVPVSAPATSTRYRKQPIPVTRPGKLESL